MDNHDGVIKLEVSMNYPTIREFIDSNLEESKSSNEFTKRLSYFSTEILLTASIVCLCYSITLKSIVPESMLLISLVMIFFIIKSNQHINFMMKELQDHGKIIQDAYKANKEPLTSLTKFNEIQGQYKSHIKVTCILSIISLLYGIGTFIVLLTLLMH